MVNIAATSKRSFSSKANVLFYVIFSSFRWRRTHSNGTGGCIFKKVGVRKTIVITSITFLPELSLIFSEIMHLRSQVFWPIGERIPSVARPIFVTMMKECVQAIQNHMLSCFRSKNWCVWTIFIKCISMARACCFRPTQAHFRCRTPKLRSQDESIYQDHSESHACLF